MHLSQVEVFKLEVLDRLVDGFPVIPTKYHERELCDFEMSKHSLKGKMTMEEVNELLFIGSPSDESHICTTIEVNTGESTSVLRIWNVAPKLRHASSSESVSKSTIQHVSFAIEACFHHYDILQIDNPWIQMLFGGCNNHSVAMVVIVGINMESYKSSKQIINFWRKLLADNADNLDSSPGSNFSSLSEKTDVNKLPATAGKSARKNRKSKGHQKKLQLTPLSTAATNLFGGGEKGIAAAEPDDLDLITSDLRDMVIGDNEKGALELDQEQDQVVLLTPMKFYKGGNFTPKEGDPQSGHAPKGGGFYPSSIAKATKAKQGRTPMKSLSLSDSENLSQSGGVQNPVSFETPNKKN